MKIRCVLLAILVSLTSGLVSDAADSLGVNNLVTEHVGEDATFDDLAASASEVTGMSIHPFFVVSALGAYKYYSAAEIERPNLDWYCNPVVWGTIAAILAIIHLRRYVTIACPVITKPIEAAENLMNQAAPAVGGSAVLPSAVKTGAGVIGALAEASQSGMADGVMYASFASPTVIQILGWSVFGIILIGGFASVWFVSNAIDVLLLLCPIGGVELLTTYGKIGIIGLIAVLALISPILALAFCAVIVLIAWKIAGWAFRLTVFGWVLSSDLLLGWAIHRNVDCTSPKAFCAFKKSKVPSRTYGRIVKLPSGELAFRYRPGLVLPPRTVLIPQVNQKLIVGTFMPSVWAGDGKEQMRCLLPPRYRGKEESLQIALRIATMEDGAMLRGFKSLGRWIKESFGQGPSSLPASS